MEEVLDVVKSSLADKPTELTFIPSGPSSAPQAEVYAEPDSQMDDDYWEEDANEDEFVDQGEGAGVEGDLEMDED